MHLRIDSTEGQESSHLRTAPVCHLVCGYLLRYPSPVQLRWDCMYKGPEKARCCRAQPVCPRFPFEQDRFSATEARCSLSNLLGEGKSPHHRKNFTGSLDPIQTYPYLCLLQSLPVYLGCQKLTIINFTVFEA